VTNVGRIDDSSDRILGLDWGDWPDASFSAGDLRCLR
jgi:hypothetical protein